MNKIKNIMLVIGIIVAVAIVLWFLFFSERIEVVEASNVCPEGNGWTLHQKPPFIKPTAVQEVQPHGSLTTILQPGFYLDSTYT